MKPIIICCLIIIASNNSFAQSESPFHHAFQIKVDPISLAYDFSRAGIIIEKKFTRHSFWIAGYKGYNLDASQNRDVLMGYYAYNGIQVGLKRIYPESKGEYYFGGHVGFDHAHRYYSADVYYDLDQNSAVLFSGASYRRRRLSAFAETGYEFFIGNRFSIEMAGGIGLQSIQNYYRSVRNPFELEDVPPREFRRKYFHKYVGNFWKPAFSYSVKFGWRL